MTISLPVPCSVVPEEAARPTTAKPFGLRAAAYLIDAAALFGLTRLLGLVGFGFVPHLLALFGRELYFAKTVEYSSGLRLLDSGVTFFLYAVPFEWLFGATIGKLILNMRVVQLDGQLCGLGAAVVRGALRIVDQFAAGLVAAYSMKMNPELQQRLGDKAARTVVVDRREPFIRNRRAPWRLLVALAAFLVLAQAWIVVFVVVTGQYVISPKVEPVAVAAAAANLQGTDFSPALKLSQDSGLADFTGFDGKDINERLFVSGDAVVQSRVMLFDSILNDTAEALSQTAKEGLAKEFEGSQLTVEESQAVPVGDLAVLRKFADDAAGREGYILNFRRSNAFVRLIFYAPPGRFTAEQASVVAGIIDARLASRGAKSR